MRKRSAITLLMLLLLGSVVGWSTWHWHTASARRLAQARAHLTESQPQEAQRLALAVLEQEPQSIEASWLAAASALELDQFDAALAAYGQLPKESRGPLLERLLGAGERAIRSGQLQKAEQLLLAALPLAPQHVVIHDRLASIYALQGRREACRTQALALVRQERGVVGHLIMLSYDQMQFDIRQLRDAGQNTTDDLGMRLVTGAYALRHNQTALTIERLRPVVAAKPDWLDAQAMLGRSLLDSGDDEAFVAWLRQLPEAAQEHDEVWAIRGLLERREKRPRVAVRCFWEAVRRNPNHVGANYQLVRQLTALGESTLAQPFLERVTQLQILDGLVTRIGRERRNAKAMQEAAEITERLGRRWEAYGWSQLAFEHDHRLTSARDNWLRLKQELQADMPLTMPSANPALQVDLSSFPLPDRMPSASASRIASQTTEDSRPNDGAGAIRFVNQAAEAQLDFVHVSKTDKEPGSRMCELFAGGVGVVDYDQDGWPDLYFTQGGPWPPNPQQTQFVHRLFRNLGGERFQDVTAQAGVGSNAYGQGVAVGDYDNDGFPDLYVAHFGRNRLYRNHGDGTFADVTAESGIAGECWTSSCLIADLNGDGLPDLYDVTYLTDRRRLEQSCYRPGHASLCTPDVFQAEQDHLFMNVGDGTFRDVSEAAGIVVPDGKGLGLVAADFNGSGQLSLFVANDDVPSFYFVNRTAKPGGLPTFADRGVSSGLAYNGDGHTQGSMGVAADDFDGNGLLDLFVTTFENQSKTLYLQESPDQFVDASRQFGLRDPLWSMVGFGTQAMDADLDGYPDLVVTNGHLYDVSSEGTPYRMRPQFFRNLHGRRFRELPPAEVGAWFAGAYLGRGLARLDWNRDGREDFVVAQLDGPAALVTNVSPNVGHYLALRLVGTSGARDAIGATVRVTAAGRTWMKQLTAGDGYQASNQRQLVFGLGRAEQVETVKVSWPGGQPQAFSGMAVDRQVALIEGRAEPVYLSHE
ncbi:MAG: FG-GAP-like repeat-containing protein [Planctomycetota bacterium]|nr:FG-GAP-like repeat-containing protein [Planctomycetota bacterium]